MRVPKFDCNCDIILDMEKIGVGTEEILQYTYALVPTRDIMRLCCGIKEILESRRDTDAASRAAA